MGLKGSLLITNPVPLEKEIPRAQMAGHILLALTAARLQNIF
jgi:pseudouridine-5'-phosphate glycosidase